MEHDHLIGQVNTVPVSRRAERPTSPYERRSKHLRSASARARIKTINSELPVAKITRYLHPSRQAFLPGGESFAQRVRPLSGPSAAHG
jgi:hypothetical protein